jgi:hypothetical protein
MDVRADLKRLTQMYLEANSQLRMFMPSKNVENPVYEKNTDSSLRKGTDDRYDNGY